MVFASKKKETKWITQYTSIWRSKYVAEHGTQDFNESHLKIIEYYFET